MKIVMISGNPIGHTYGGVAVHVEYLIKHLSNFKDLTLILLTFGEEPLTYVKDGIQVVVLKRMKYGRFLFPLQIFYDALRLRTAIKKINPDIIHIQSTVPTFSFFGINAGKQYPVVITLHGYFKEESRFHSGIEKIFNVLFSTPLERWALKRIPYVITVCPQLQETIQQFSSSTIVTIPNGIDLAQIQAIRPFPPFTSPTVFYVGMLNKRKGVDDLIRAIPSVKNEIKDVKVYIAGTGPELNKLKNLAKSLGLEENVSFLGFITDEKKISYMKSTDVFVLPTYWESFPLVLLEAMACGRPIISTDVGGNPSAVVDGVNGFLVKPGNWRQISEKLIYLFKNKEIFIKMGEESIKRALEFDWNPIALQTKELYLKIEDATTEKKHNKI